MLDAIFEFFYAKPRRLVFIGNALYSLATLQLLAGFVVQVLSVATSGVRATGAAVSTPSAATLAPNWPTFWVPESLAGWVVVAVIAIAGTLMAYEGRKLEKFISRY
jgi:uncharacterized membrane protein